MNQHFLNWSSEFVYIIQLMTFDEVNTRIDQSMGASVNIMCHGLINPCIHRNWKSLIVLLYSTFYVSFTLKISFDHDIFPCLPCWNVIVISRDYNVLSKIVTRDVSQSEKKHYLKSYNNIQLLTFVEVTIRIYRSKIDDIYRGQNRGKYHLSWNDRYWY